MPLTKYQKRLRSLDVIDSLDILEEVGKRLLGINAYPPILPWAGKEIADIVRETREIIAERDNDGATEVAGSDDGSPTSGG